MASETTSHRRITKLSHRSERRKCDEAAFVSDAANCFLVGRGRASQIVQPHDKWFLSVNFPDNEQVFPKLNDFGGYVY
jgi:hypothetical protein